MQKQLTRIHVWWDGVSSLTKKRSVAILLGAALIYFSLDLSRPAITYKVFLHDLDTKDAVNATRALREIGVEFKIMDKGNIILIPDGTDSDALHLQLAEQEALPHQNDLLNISNLPGVSASATGMKHLKRQAVQERLARTIRQYPQVVKATVFVTGSRPSAFVRNKTAAKASVMLLLRVSFQNASSTALPIWSRARRKASLPELSPSPTNPASSKRPLVPAARSTGIDSISRRIMRNISCPKR